MKELFEHIEYLKTEFHNLQPLSYESKAKLDKKFRLEWNFNSNHIEGNTLTYGETELLLIFDETKGNHEFREYEEMKNHDLALKLIYDLASDNERELTENFIIEINQVLLVRPFYKDAITPDGQPTRRLIKIGEYKSFSNSVRLSNGELFEYASPSETPALMNDLMKWYAGAKNANQLPAEVAAELHYRFVSIHPFDDGNGRIARLLMNYHLIKNDFPPVIIKSADKRNYLFALHEADTGNMDVFKKYIAEELIWSLEISLKGARGENIDEPGDWEKKIKLVRQELDPSLTLEKLKSSEVIAEVFNNSIFTFIDFLLNKLKPVSDLFFSHSIKVHIQNFGQTNKLKEINAFKQYFSQFTNNRIEIDTTQIYYYLENFKNNGTNSFDIVYLIQIKFNKFSYSISIDKIPMLKVEKYYHQSFSEEDLEYFANGITEHVINSINEIKEPLN